VCILYVCMYICVCVCVFVCVGGGGGLGGGFLVLFINSRGVRYAGFFFYFS